MWFHFSSGPSELNVLEKQSPAFLAQETGFVEDSFSWVGGRWGVVWGVVQAHYIQCVLYFYYHHTVIYYTTQHSAESVRTPSLSSCNWTLPSGAMGNGYKYRWSFLTDHELVLVRDLGVEDPGARIWLNLTNTRYYFIITAATTINII